MVEVITMAGQAIFSDIEAVIYGKVGQRYTRIVKRFGNELKRQKIVPRIQAGVIKNFIESEIIADEDIKRIFQISWGQDYYMHADITIFTWE